MPIKDSRTRLSWLIVGAVAMVMSSGTVLAEDSPAPARKGALPGVTSDYRIAKPAPEPAPDDVVPGNGAGQFKIGDTDVRISGSITIDIGAGSIKSSHR
ncbi:MAG: hypothetical protein E5W83_09985 [Mesorhizobium sp.]|nr:MAG: hypothetical protein E5W91_08115 [Mesorhizobium sp.]TIS92053.1 MAG: hypothetical protein E5W89_04160 [Mesorhizobium sp.]TJW46115.1 MAG: hypothetical protein E5W83_09985 [Mesorhizobium sp.]